VTLPADQQQVLDRIETDLEGSEPRLRSMFAIFTRLTRDEGAPATEWLRPEGRHVRWAWPGRRLRAVVVVPLALGLVALFLFMAINSSAAPACGTPPPGAHVATIHTTACQSVLETHGRS